jgi:mannose-6-phosphate isomerase-like protein (cupin superfamily)
VFVTDVVTAPRRERGGLLSHVLLQDGDVPGTSLTVTWVEVAAGGAQEEHSHDAEQVYVVVRGQARMTVGPETQRIQGGQLVHIPVGTAHAIRNDSHEPLLYVSATSPAVRITDLYDSGMLRAKHQDRREG